MERIEKYKEYHTYQFSFILDSVNILTCTDSPEMIIFCSNDHILLKPFTLAIEYY